MKKKVRRLSALLLACVMIFAMQSTAFASAEEVYNEPDGYSGSLCTTISEIDMVSMLA